jgi:glycosyl hydrolase family 99
LKIQALLTILLLPLSFLVARPTEVHAAAPTFPIRAAFYYPWFPEAWNQSGINPFTWYSPIPDGYYNSSTAAVIDDHIARMQYGGINVGIASWWGQGSKTDLRISLLLAEAHSRNFYWTPYYEPALSIDTASDLTYIASHYGSDPNFLHVGGKPVLFIYTRAVKTCADVVTWEAANAGQFYLDPQVFGGYRACAVQPESWHQYAPTSAEDRQTGYSFTISPGFWLRTDAAPRLVRDPVRWRTNVQDMVASGAPWQLITTFNEWGEGTAVEDAAQWQSRSRYGVYLDELNSNGDGIPSPAPTQSSPVPQPTRSPAAQSGPAQPGDRIPPVQPASLTTPSSATTKSMTAGPSEIFTSTRLAIESALTRRAWRVLPR